MTVRAGFTLVGQVVGASIGGPIGAAIGGMVGGMVGGAIEGPTRNTQALLDDLGAIKFDYGSSWPRIYGSYRVKVAPIWSSEKRPVAHDEEVDSKGGPDQVNRTFTYEQDWLCWAPLNATDWARIWINGKLRASRRFDADDGTIEATAGQPAWADVTFYDGAADQLPWPVYEAAVGAENACAYRHRPTICFASLDLGTGGQPPLIEVEFVSSATTAQSGFVEDFESSYPTEYTTTNADGIVSAQAGPWGNALYFAGGYMTASSAVVWREIEVEPVTRVSFNFKLDYFPHVYRTWNAPALKIWKADNTPLLAFYAARDMYFDLHQSPAIALGSSGSPVSIGLGPLAENVWYRCDIEISDSVLTLTIAQADSGIVERIYTATPPDAVFDVGILRFSDDYCDACSDVNPGCWFDNVTFGAVAERVTPAAVPLSDIVRAEALLEWTGEAGALTADDIDVTALAGVEVTGFLTTGSPRESIAQLMDAFYFGATCSDKLHFRLRGGASVATVSAADTGAGVGQAGEIFAGLERGNDLEQAIQVAFTGPNVLSDYEPGTENSDRLVGSSVELRRYTTPVVFTPAERKGRADTMVLDGRVASHTGQIALDDAYMALEPCDVWLQYDDEGNTYRVRAERERYADGVRTFDVVLDDPTVLSTVGITTERDTRALQLRPVADTEAMLVDAPILRDADDARGFYALARSAESGRWPGFSIFKSADNVTYASAAGGSQAGVFGTCSAVPGAWDGPARVFNERHAIVVDVGSGTLTGSTRDAVLNDAAVNAFAIGAHGRWLLGQFRDAELVSAGVYRLTGLLLGAGGTERHIGTQLVGDSFALLRYVNGLVRVPTNAVDQGVPRYYKPVTIGQAVSAADTLSFVGSEVGLMPLAPVDARASRAAGDITITWQFRTRLQVRMIGPAGILVPLGEASESYAIDVFADDTFAVVVRTLTSSSPTVTYTAAQQTTDFGSPQAEVSFGIQMISATVGRGFALRATL